MKANLWTIDDAHIEHSRGAIKGHLLQTPIVPGTSVGPNVWLKLENHQTTGSFKVRGALAFFSALDESEREAGVVAASAGNHGMGVAFAANRYRVPAKVFVPKGTPQVKRLGIQRLGAEVVVTKHAGYDETEAQARAAADEFGSTFISPFDNPFVAAGNGATLGEAILAGVDGLVRIVAPIGGGGLMAGLAAIRDRNAPTVELIGVESEACPSMHDSIEEGRALERYEGKPTRAEGLEGGVSPSTFEICRKAVRSVELVSEGEIGDAIRFCREVLGERVEGSAAVTVAYARSQTFEAPPHW